MSPMLERPLQIDLPEAPAPTVEEPSNKQQQYVPRGVYLRKEEFMKYGYTPGCDGCIAAEFGMARRHHSQQCRSRLYEAMKQDEQGRARIEQAQEREMKYFDKVRQEMEDSAKLAGSEKRSADTDPTVSEFDLPALRESSASTSAKPAMRMVGQSKARKLVPPAEVRLPVEEGQVAEMALEDESSQSEPRVQGMDVDGLLPSCRNSEACRHFVAATRAT